MEIVLLHYTPLHICSTAVRTCWDSHDKSDTIVLSDSTGRTVSCPKGSEEYYTNPFNTDVMPKKLGQKDAELIERVGNKFKHESTLEHLVYTFNVEGISRALLQELARHRIASYSVKSSRYTLKELKNEEPFCSADFDYKGWLTGSKDAKGSFDSERASEYIVYTGNQRIDISSVVALENLRIQLRSGVSNDIAKYAMPESYKTSLVWTINARSLQNFLSLRINHKHALWEIVQLAENIVMVLPQDHKYLYADIVNEYASPEFKEVFSKSMV